MGDAAHTAHFSIGSGTKLALEDAIELHRSITSRNNDLQAGLEHYQEVRALEVLIIQNAARNSTEWFEKVGRYDDRKSVMEGKRVSVRGAVGRSSIIKINHQTTFHYTHSTL